MPLTRKGCQALLLAAVLTAAGCGGGSSDTPSAAGPVAAGDWPPAVQFSPATACAPALTGSHATYHVGPGQSYTELTDIPWLSLQAGDVVNIHYRATPYRTKFGLRAQGTAENPVIINGVTDGACQRPEISGDGAATASDAIAAGFGSGLETLGLILIYRNPGDASETFTPKHIIIQNLKMAGARHGKNFTAQDGSTQTYDHFSAAIYAVRVHHLTVENCEITGNGLGVFTNSRGYSPDDYSAWLFFRRNRVYDNGNPGRSTEHNFYTQGRRVLFEGNYIGQAYGGSSLKDRSSGTVVRFNKIVAGARALDLVETEEEFSRNVSTDPLYPYAWVYGNVIVNDGTAPQGFSVRMIHWGFDNNIHQARTGTLFFYGNTLLNSVNQDQFWYINIFQIGNEALPSPASRIDAWSNIFWQQGTAEWRFVSDVGQLTLRGKNYVPTGWFATGPGNSASVNTGGGMLLTGVAPQVDANLLPQAGSPVLDQGAAPALSIPAGFDTRTLQLSGQYAEGRGVVPRPSGGSAPDLGAFERP